MPSIASWRSHQTAACSGLAKLRQLVIAAGFAPVATTLRAASQTAIIAPCLASSAVYRELPSVASASPTACPRPAPALHHRREGSPSRRRPGGRSGGRRAPGSRGSGCRAVPAVPRRASTTAAAISARLSRRAMVRLPDAVRVRSRGGAPSTSRSSGRSQTLLDAVAHHEALLGEDDRDHVGMQVPALEHSLERSHVARLARR